MNKIKKIVFPLFIASITGLASTTYGCIYYGSGSTGNAYDSGSYNKIKKDFYTKDIVKDYASCQKKCESLNMFVDSFDKGNSCSCTY